MKYDYDCCVIGGGAAGLTAAKGAHGLGKKTVIIESNKLGGECTLTGCIPSKALIKSAHVAHQACNLKKFGLDQKGECVIGTTTVMGYVQGIVQDIYNTHTPDKIRDLGIAVEFGEYVFKDVHTIVSDKKTITADKFIICTGSHAFVPPIDGLDTVDYLTNENLFTLQELPTSLAILGGGPIGMEMASALNRLGVRVTVIEMNKQVLPREDAELVELLVTAMVSEGVIIRTGLRAQAVAQVDGQINVTCLDEYNQEHAIAAEKLLIAVGRGPNSKRLGLEQVGVVVDKQEIVVDAHLRTSQKNIFAAGDVVGPYQFSHMANYQARIAVRNAFVPLFKQKVDYTNVCWVTFTAPELATAGLTEDQARDQYGSSITVYKKEYRTIDRAHTEGDLTGLAKFVCDKSGYLLGASILGAGAGELIHEVQVGKVYTVKFPDFYNVIHAYPTYSDIILHASKDAYFERLKNNIFVKLARQFLG
jgi:pyruvate/2-oxoglutarate dehydrogenase complex dihydrolipoamide dehydrogenase (E3) component